MSTKAEVNPEIKARAEIEAATEMDFEAQVLPAQIKILRRAELIAH